MGGARVEPIPVRHEILMADQLRSAIFIALVQLLDIHPFYFQLYCVVVALHLINLSY